MSSRLAVGKGLHLYKGFVVALIVALGIVGFILYQNKPAGFSSFNNLLSTHTIYVNGFGISVRVAKTDAEKLRGLNDIQSMPKNAGIIYAYEQDGIYGISTTDMHFPVDIIWLDKNGDVVDVRVNIEPGRIYPVRNTSLARYVLMVNAGVAGDNDIIPKNHIALPRI